jgi:hypothetical protein
MQWMRDCPSNPKFDNDFEDGGSEHKIFAQIATSFPKFCAQFGLKLGFSYLAYAKKRHIWNSWQASKQVDSLHAF